MTKLTELNLSGNNFSGTFPPSISCLVNLKVLKIYSNNIEDELPPWMSCLSNLTDLNLSRNRYILITYILLIVVLINSFDSLVYINSFSFLYNIYLIFE